jgi:hypothetical protein
VGPGAVITPIFDKIDGMDLRQYDQTDYAPIIQRFRDFFAVEAKKGLAAEEIGRLVHRALTVRKPKVRYAAVAQRFKNWTLPMLLPKRVVDRAIAKQFGLVKK